MLKRLRSKSSSTVDLPISGDQLASSNDEVGSPQIHPELGTTRGGLVAGSLQIALVLVLMVLAIYYAQAPTAPTSSSNMFSGSGPDMASAPNVSIISPVAGAHQIALEGSGSVGVTTYVELVPEVSGRIATLSPVMEVGGRFSAGETLITIEQTEFLLQLRQAQADVAVQRANLELQRAKSDAAVANYGLINPGKRVPNLVALRPQIAQAEARLLAAQSREDIAQLNLARTRFSLPFDGVITASSAQRGQLVSSGKSFGKAYATDSVEMVVPISQSDLALIMPAEDLTVVINTAGKRIEAKVDRVSGELDTRSRFAKIYVPVNRGPNNDELKPGMFADVTIEGPVHQDSLVLPESALQANGDLWLVRGGTIEKHKPQILGGNARGVVVQSFNLGEGIVVGSVVGAADGMQVTAFPFENAQLVKL